MQTSENGIAFIKRNEGFSSAVYIDNGKQCVGYGHDLLPGESFPNGVSLDEADLLLRKDLASRFEPAVNSLIPYTCTQNQFDALCDFAYNLGADDLAVMMSHGWDEVPQQIPRWCYKHVNGQVVRDPGLANRRTAEVDLFNS